MDSGIEVKEEADAMNDDSEDSDDTDVDDVVKKEKENPNNEEEDIRDFIENKHLYRGGGDTIKVEDCAYESLKGFEDFRSCCRRF